MEAVFDFVARIAIEVLFAYIALWITLLTVSLLRNDFTKLPCFGCFGHCDKLDHAQQLVGRQLAMLRKLEHCCTRSDDWASKLWCVCPICGSSEGRAHKPDCELGRLLAASKPEDPTDV